MKYRAGWHIPGCLPEVPYEEFDSKFWARRYEVEVC